MAGKLQIETTIEITPICCGLNPMDALEVGQAGTRYKCSKCNREITLQYTRLTREVVQ